MIVATLIRGQHQIMNIHKLPVSGRYALEVTKYGYNDNKNWPEEFDHLEDAIAFAKVYNWKEVNEG